MRKFCCRVARALAVLAPLLAGTAAQAQGCAPATAADWMSNAVARNPLAQDIRPRDCDTVLQTPPDFRWPDVVTSGGYSLALTYPDGRTRTLPTIQNWHNWDEVLPPGTYRWTVGYPGGPTSATRTFIVDGGAQPFLVPSVAVLASSVAARPHPRSMPDAAAIGAMQSQRSAAIEQLRNDVGGRFGMPLPGQGGGADDAFVYSKYALASIAACVLGNREAAYCNEAIRRVMNLALWDPNGPTSYYAYGANMAGRYLTWTVAVGYDWLYPMLTEQQRTALLSVLWTRTAQMYDDVIGARSRIASFPRDPQAGQTLYFVALLSTLLAGDLPIATTSWMPRAVPLALNALSPWGGEEGGFANGATPGNWDVGELLPVLYQLRIATGIDAGRKAWLRNWSRYFAYFTPPGMGAGTTVFGDGLELDESERQARYGKAYTYFAPSPLGRWHMSLLRGEDPTRFELVMAPPADFSGAQPFPGGTPNSLYLKSIGQVAMHSDLSDPARVSVYFKSSPPPFGAFNHSHADQNGFVVNAGGERLAIESGYYDGFRTQHWWNWYHETRAKNAITYDGGKGQISLDRNGVMGTGRIAGFMSTAGYDVVTGDATRAYGGVLSLAQRSLIYLRPNFIVVYDNLVARAPHVWEWNIHALNPMTSSSETTAVIRSGTQRMCVTMLAGPAPMRFAQTSQFAASPAGSNRAPQWHGRFSSGVALNAAEFVALLNVGCLPVSASALKSGGAWTIAVGNATITLSGATISVTGVGTATTAATGAATTSAAGTPGASGTPSAMPATRYAGAPFGGAPIALPGRFEAENFDAGGQNVAYYDTTPGNIGGQHRSGDVDIVRSCDSAGGGFVVNNLASGEWMNYTVNAATSGSYVFQLRAANNAADAPAAFHLEVDGVRATGPVPVPRTGAWCSFQWVPAPAVNLAAGRHVLRVVSDRQYFNLNSVSAALLGSAVPPPTPFMSTYRGRPYAGTPAAVPGTLLAANFDIGGQGIAYNETTAINVGGQYRPDEAVDIVPSCDPAPTSGYVVNNFATGEWLNYTVHAATDGNYLVQLRASNDSSDAVAFRVEVDGAPVTGRVTVPRTGAWCAFAPVVTTPFQLAAGPHVLRIVSDQAYFNLQTVHVVRSP